MPTERELVARLAPESPLLFARARRILRDVTGTASGLRIGGSTGTVHHTADGWRAGRTVHETARHALADAVGTLIAEAGTSVNSEVLRTAGLIESGPDVGSGPDWALTETGRRLRDAPRPAGPCIALDDIQGHRYLDYFIVHPGPPPAEGPSLTVHEVFTLAAHNELPAPHPISPVTLPPGTILDSHAGPDDVFLYTPGTPFHRQALWGAPERHPHHRYHLQIPLPVYPSFPYETTTAPTEKPQTEGQGYYLIDPISTLLKTNHLTQQPPTHKLRQQRR